MNATKEMTASIPNASNTSTTAASPSPTAQQQNPRAPPERRESTAEKSSSGGEEDKRSESSSGSGGYNADYESSESSLSSKQINAIQQREDTLNNSIKDDTAKVKATNPQQRRHSHGNSSCAGSKKSTKSKDSATSLDQMNQQLQALLPQWNGIRITHPMDPRIDLSTVGFTVSAGPAAPLAPSPSGDSTTNPNHNSDHYIHLMEVRSNEMCFSSLLTVVVCFLSFVLHICIFLTYLTECRLFDLSLEPTYP